MLPPKNRLVKKNDFERLFKKGSFLNSQLFSLRFIKNGLADSRFGFVVSAKISKKAVERNKIKRRLRESIRAILENIHPGVDVSITTKPTIKNKKFEDIIEEIEKIFKKAGLVG